MTAVVVSRRNRRDNVGKKKKNLQMKNVETKEQNYVLATGRYISVGIVCYVFVSVDIYCRIVVTGFHFESPS